MTVNRYWDGLPPNKKENTFIRSLNHFGTNYCIDKFCFNKNIFVNLLITDVAINVVTLSTIITPLVWSNFLTKVPFVLSLKIIFTLNQNISYHRCQMSNKYLAGVGLVGVFSPRKGSLIRPFCPAMSGNMTQNCQTGEQMTHRDKLKKENSNSVALFNMSQCVICSPVWRFVPRDHSAAKGPLLASL